MNLRRILIAAALLLIVFLSVYSWNQGTHVLDDLATNIGLEVGGAALRPVRSVEDSVSNLWSHYFDLVGVREENGQLKARIQLLEQKLAEHAEDLAELARLRTLMDLPKDTNWRTFGARVLAGRIGPNAVQESITIGRGYTNGGRPGTPLITNKGLVGRVLKASAHTSTVLLLSDSGSRISVLAQNSRARGILRGQGNGKPLEMEYVSRDSVVAPGDILVTSGLDGMYPKGIPVARVLSVAPSDYTEFLAIAAESLVDTQHLEEVILLEQVEHLAGEKISENARQDFVGPPAPEGKPAQ